MHDWKRIPSPNVQSVVPFAFQYIAEQVLDGIMVFDGYGKILYANHAAAKVYGYSTDEFKKISFCELYATPRECNFAKLMENARHEAILCQAVHKKQDQSTFSVEIKYCRFSLGETTVLVGILCGKAGEKPDNYQLLHRKLLATYEKLVSSEEKLRHQFDELLLKEEKIYRQNAVLNLLHELTAGLMADIDHDNDIFEKIVTGVKELLNAPNTFVHIFNEEQGTYTVKNGSGIFKQFVQEEDITQGLVGEVYRTGKMAMVSHYHAWPYRLPHSIFDNADYSVVVPLKQKHRMIGALGLVFVEPGRFLSTEELFLLQRFADLAAIALSNFFLVTSLRQKIQEHQRAEEQHRQSEERFFIAFEMSPSAVAIARMNGTYMNVNENFCQVTGYTKEELIDRTREKIGLWHEEDKRSLLEALEKYGQVNNFEAWFRRKDGSEVCGLMSARIVTIEDERCILTITSDITERKKITEQLKISEKKFSQAFYLSPDAIVISRRDGTYVEVNQGFVRMSGFSAEEVIGKNAIELGIWPDPKERERMVLDQEKQGELHGLEIPFRRKDGHIIYGQVSVGKLELKGEPCYMVIIRDITERRQAEKVRRLQEAALLDGKNKLSIAAGLAHLGPWEYTPATGLFMFSDEFYDLYATTVTYEGCNMSWDDYVSKFVHPEDAWMLGNEKVFLSCGAGMNMHEPFSDVIHRIIRRDGKVRTVLVRRIAVKDNAGRLIKIYGMNQDITERVQSEAERSKQEDAIKRLAYFDSLTGLANRHQLNEWLLDEMERARRGEVQGAVLFIDLDDLKLVNDTYGHTYGDQIIIEAGLRIVKVVGKEIFVARVSGDEFVVILSGIQDPNKIENLVREVSEALGKTHEIFGIQFHMSASIGIAAYPADGNQAEEIIKNADNAMYAAKRSGKNCWRFYTETMQQEAYKEMRLTNSLRDALALNEFFLVYQPKVTIVGKKVIGFEALLRWHNNEHGNVPPLQFIPLAEQSGLIHSIGKWVLREACGFVRYLSEQGQNDIHVAVNISAKQIAADDFIAIIRNAIEDAAIAAEQLELEITESTLMTSLEDATNKLRQIRDMGVHLSLDDFGTGFSSLTYLLRLPVETLKLDKAFVDMISTDFQGEKMISSIIDLAHAIHMKVLAEGVETEQQMAYLTENDCDYIQGYLVSAPMPGDEAIKLLVEQDKKD